jgi:hypothetical protein
LFQGVKAFFLHFSAAFLAIFAACINPYWILIRASRTGRRISDAHNVRAHLFASTQMVEIDRAPVCVEGAQGHNAFFRFCIFFNIKT